MSKKTAGVNYSKYGYIFSIPFVVAFCLFTMYPLFNTAFMSFTDYAGIRAVESGQMNILSDPLALYKNLLTDNPTFRTSFYNTLQMWIINFIPQVALALVLAAWFTGRRTNLKGQGLFKVLFYMPNIITAGTIAFLFRTLFDNYGPVNYLLTEVGILNELFEFRRSKLASQLIISFIQFWMWYGYTMLIFIAGIMGLNPEMYECAEIDGANSVQQFFRITLPNLKTIILFTLVTSTVGGLTMFDIPRLFGGNTGDPVNATLTMSMFIYNQAFGTQLFLNRAAAASMLIFIMVALLSIIIFYLFRDKDAAKEKREIRARKRDLKRVQKGAY